MNTRKIEKLLPYPENNRVNTPDDIDRAATILSSMGQFESLLITPAGDNEHDVVLGGNQRLQAMIKLGWIDCEVSVVEFFQNDNGLWQATLNGVNQKKEYASKEAGMMEYSLAANTRFARYVEDQLAQSLQEMEIDSGLYTVDLIDPTELSDLEASLNQTLKDEPKKEDDAPEHTDTDAQEKEEADKLLKLVVYFKDEDERRAFYDKTKSIGYECKLV